MLSLIEKLQRKPEATRRKILYATVFACSALIFGIWVTTLPGRLAGVSGNGNEKEGISPFVVLKEAMSDIFSDFSDSVGDIKEQTGAIRSSIVEVVNDTASSTDETVIIDSATTTTEE